MSVRFTHHSRGHERSFGIHSEFFFAARAAADALLSSMLVESVMGWEGVNLPLCVAVDGGNDDESVSLRDLFRVPNAVSYIHTYISPALN